MNAQFDIFLSHNKADKPWAERLANAIEADRNGPPLKVFFDKWEIPAGANIPIEMENGLQSSRYVGLVLSPESVDSRWVALERSTAIYDDPDARTRRLIPLLLRDCKIPELLRPLNYVDFRREQDFGDGVSTLVNALRGVSTRIRDPSDLLYRQDAALLKQHRRIFDRSAFKVSCIWELFLRELNRAIDDTAMAINTGSLYSRDGQLLGSFPDHNEYKLPQFKQAFSRITAKLFVLKREVTQFEMTFRRSNPDYDHHENFYAMLMSFASKQQPDVVRQLVTSMDRIDALRNDIVGEVNALLSECHEPLLPIIELSSNVIRQRQIGGAEEIAQQLEV